MSIWICSLAATPQLVRQLRPSRVVSLLSPYDTFPAFEGFGSDLHLQVPIHDIVDDVGEWRAPDLSDAESVINFVQPWDRAAPMLIHCWAGISRSTASAFITACLHNPEAEEQEIAAAIRAKYADQATKVTTSIRMNQVITEVPFGDGTVNLYSAVERVAYPGSYRVLDKDKLEITMKKGGTLIWGHSETTQNLDMHQTGTASSGRVLQNIHSSIVTVDKDLNVIPGLAESFEVAEDGLTYTFKLRPNLKWSDGSALTADEMALGIVRTAGHQHHFTRTAHGPEGAPVNRQN